MILDPGIKIEDGYKAYDEGIEQNVFITMQDGVTPVETEVCLFLFKTDNTLYKTCIGQS